MNGKYSYCIKTLWGMSVTVVCLPCEVQLLVREYSFPYLSHHEQNILPYSIDGRFANRILTGGDMTYFYTLFNTSTLSYARVLLLFCHHLEENKLRSEPGPEADTSEGQTWF